LTLWLAAFACTLEGPEDKARDNVEAGARGEPPVPIPVGSSGQPLQPKDVEVDPFITAVKATRDGGVVTVRYTGALPADGS